MTPSQGHTVEMLSYYMAQANMEGEHLREREKQYVEASLLCPGSIIILKQTNEGWWKESYDFKKNPKKLIEKLVNDPEVAYVWAITQRFNEPGGWYDPC